MGKIADAFRERIEHYKQSGAHEKAVALEALLKEAAKYDEDRPHDQHGG